LVSSWDLVAPAGLTFRGAEERRSKARCSEGELYGERLQQAGVPVEIIRHLGVVHGFVS
jgi:acetyl esterase/lipase